MPIPPTIMINLKKNLMKIQDLLFSLRTTNKDKIKQINDCHNSIIKMEKLLWIVFNDSKNNKWLLYPGPSPPSVAEIKEFKYNDYMSRSF